jgi:adenylate cyclase class 2
MKFEVENKFPVADLSDFERRLSAMDADIDPPILQVDTYFAHPERDFAATDEALRIRRVGDDNFITYKGPKIDATTKTRREIELPIASGDRGAADWTALLEVLGFRAVAEVRKRRRPVKIRWDGQPVHGALDEVDNLGSFVELEIVADAAHVSEARNHLTSLARHLGLSKPERRSYLELLLAR